MLVNTKPINNGIIKISTKIMNPVYQRQPIVPLYSNGSTTSSAISNKLEFSVLLLVNNERFVVVLRK